MTFAAWLFNPWDHGDVALLFAVVVAATAFIGSRFRTGMSVGRTSLIVAVAVTAIYMVGAIATAGFGPLAPLGAIMLFLPALLISWLIIGAVTAISPPGASN